MKFVSKSMNSFWVEDFTEDEKEFFLSIGFTEFKYRSGYNKISTNLTFKGSQIAGIWSQDEMNNICEKIYDRFPEIDQIEVEEMNHFH